MKHKGKKPGGRGRTRNYPDDAPITLLVEGNPSRRGTAAHKWFELAKRSETFGDYHAAGEA